MDSPIVFFVFVHIRNNLSIRLILRLSKYILGSGKRQASRTKTTRLMKKCNSKGCIDVALVTGYEGRE